MDITNTAAANKPSTLPPTKMTKWGFMVYLVRRPNGSPCYVSVPE